MATSTKPVANPNQRAIRIKNRLESSVAAVASLIVFLLKLKNRLLAIKSAAAKPRQRVLTGGK